MPTIRKFSSFINTRPVSFRTIVSEFGYDRIHRQVIEVGNKNIVAFVNASARDSLLKTKMQRYLSGDLLALGSGSAQGIYTDVCGFPTDYNSIQATLSRVNEHLRNHNVSNVPDLVKSLSSKINGSSSENLTESGESNVNEE